MSKKQNSYKGYLRWQSEFSRRFATWANNHRGWSKMKKSNKRNAKRRMKQELDKMMNEEVQE